MTVLLCELLLASMRWGRASLLMLCHVPDHARASRPQLLCWDLSSLRPHTGVLRCVPHHGVDYFRGGVDVDRRVTVLRLLVLRLWWSVLGLGHRALQLCLVVHPTGCLQPVG